MGFLANDWLVSTQASEHDGLRPADVLCIYQTGSGEMVNTTKSAISFSANCDDAMKGKMKLSSSIRIEAPCEKFLGFPSVTGQSTTEAFKPILANVRGLVVGQREKLLSGGVAKEAIATYMMNYFILTTRTRKEDYLGYVKLLVCRFNRKMIHSLEALSAPYATKKQQR